ncbi:MAG: hypothetical protein R3279_11150, partial [Putridiphycobacter sp.]|nr:hypothetical protein [Putridiphycobacter sp.]
MKFSIVSLVSAAILLSCTDQQDRPIVEKAQEIQTYSIEQFMDNEAIGGGSFSADNSQLLISSNRS